LPTAQPVAIEPPEALLVAPEALLVPLLPGRLVPPWPFTPEPLATPPHGAPVVSLLVPSPCGLLEQLAEMTRDPRHKTVLTIDMASVLGWIGDVTTVVVSDARMQSAEGRDGRSPDGRGAAIAGEPPPGPRLRPRPRQFGQPRQRSWASGCGVVRCGAEGTEGSAPNQPSHEPSFTPGRVRSERHVSASPLACSSGSVPCVRRFPRETRSGTDR
jgi:hypothetical protein